MIQPRPGAPPIVAPAPLATHGRVLVRRHHAFVPDALFASTDQGTAATVRALYRRYPRALTKGLEYLRTEGLAQTWTKLRTRATLTRLEQARAAFAAVGTVVDAPGTSFASGTPVLCWSWQGPTDADYFLIGPSQCLPIPDASPHFASAPYLAWIANVVRRLEINVASLELHGFDPSLAAPLIELAGGRSTPGAHVTVDCRAETHRHDGREDGRIAIHLRAERSATTLVETTSNGHICRLPEATHYFLDPYYPGNVEFPWPFTRETVAEAIVVLARHGLTLSTAAAPMPVTPAATTMTLASRSTPPADGTGVSTLGAGNYVRAVLLHHLQRYRTVDVCGVMDIRPEVAAIQGRALGARYCTTDPRRVIDDPDTDLVLIASDHASHADYAIAALNAGKAVHLEKPPAITADQLTRLLSCLRNTPDARLHLGYNRPHAPATKVVAARLAQLSGPTTVVCHVQGYRLGRAHWYRWPNQGTRIAGNVVHWIDLGYRLCGRQQPVAIETRPADAADPDALQLLVEFPDASRVDIRFSSDEDPTFGMRERIDIAKSGLTATIDDFRSLTVDEGGKRSRSAFPRDKGHAANMAALASLRVDHARLQDLIRDLELTGAIQLAAETSLLEGGGRLTMTASA